MLGVLACAATRPEYGGTLRIAVSSAVTSIAPADATRVSNGTAGAISCLVFETLVVLDSSATPRPGLAVDWQHDATEKKWQFQLRPGVHFHNGDPLTAITVAESLRKAGIESIAHVAATGDTVFFEADAPLPTLPAILSQIQFAITENPGGELVGTGPFKPATRTDPQTITLLANEEYWGGRPYLDGIEINLQRPLRQQMLDAELGKVDAIELELEQVRRAEQENLTVARSQPTTLLALIFDPGRPMARAETMRQAVALSIDRSSIWNVLLDKQGEPSATLLPQWINGYSFLFSTAGDVQAARALQVKSPALIVEYDFADPVTKAVAERIAVNAREAGITIQPVGEVLYGANGRADMYVLKLPIASAEPALTMKQVLDEINAFNPALKFDETQLAQVASAEKLYTFERAILAEGTIVPLAHLPQLYGLSARVHDWLQPAAGGWPLANVWLQKANSSAPNGAHP
jgi:MarR-like DNA-binding transcriptional regulator SgrR of sgrS sRNA